MNMETIELQIHAHEDDESKLIKIASGATIEQLVKEIQAAGVALDEPGEEIILWVETEKKACHKAHKLHEYGIKHGHHVHFRQRHHKNHEHVHHGPHNIILTIVVNGTPTKVEADVQAPLGSVIPKALDQTGNEGQPPENWELKDAKGVALDVKKKIEEFHFPCDVTLFLSLKAGIGG
jgi:Protein of Unknown function (DUF2604)